MRFVETDQTQSRYVESERIFHKNAEIDLSWLTRTIFDIPYDEYAS